MPTFTEAESPERFGYNQELWRTLGRTELLLYGLVGMVPIAPFALFGPVFSASHGMPALVFLAAAAALLLTATSYANMVKAFPVSGTVYTYTGRSLGASAGFLAGWMILLGYFLVPTLLYVVAAVAMNSTVPAVPIWVWALMFIAANTAVNLRGVRMTAGFIKGVIAAQLLVLALFITLGLWAVAGGKGNGFSFSAFYRSDGFSVAAVFTGVSLAVLCFLGFDGISLLVEEAKGGSRELGRAMKAALLGAGVLFTAQVWVAAMLVPQPEQVIAQGDPNGDAFYQAAAVAGGGWLSKTASTATAVSWGLAGTLVAQLAVSRLLFAMGRDGQLPRRLARVSVKRSVPVTSTLVVAGASTVFALWAVSGTGDAYGEVFLTSLVDFGALVAFVLLQVSVVVHYAIRKRSTDWLNHVLVPVAGAALLLLVIVNQRGPAQRVGGLWLLAGLLALGGRHALGRRPRLSGLGPDSGGPLTMAGPAAAAVLGSGTGAATVAEAGTETDTETEADVAVAADDAEAVPQAEVGIPHREEVP